MESAPFLELALPYNPMCKLRILRPLGWNFAVAVHGLVEPQFIIARLPCRIDPFPDNLYCAT